MYSIKEIARVNTNKHHSTWFKVLDNNAYCLDGNWLFVYQNGEKEFIKEYPDEKPKIVKSKKCVLVGNNKLGYDLIEIDRRINHEGSLRGFDIPFDSKKNYCFLYNPDFSQLQSGLFDTRKKNFTFTKNKIC